MSHSVKVVGRALSIEFYQLDEMARKRISVGEPLYPKSYISPLGKAPRSPSKRLIGLLPGASLRHNRLAFEPETLSAQSSTIFTIQPDTLIQAEGFEDGVLSLEIKKIDNLFERVILIYPHGDQLEIFALRDNLQARSMLYSEFDSSSKRFRLINHVGRTIDLDGLIKAQRKAFVQALMTSDREKLTSMLNQEFNPKQEYLGNCVSEIPQLLCNDLSTYKLLEERGALVDVSVDKTITMVATEQFSKGKLSYEIFKYIVDCDESLNTNWNGENGYLAIHRAIEIGNLDVVRVLIEAGAQLNIAANDGMTALGLAIQNNKTQMVLYLLSQGASLDTDDYELLIEGEDVEIRDPLEQVRTTEMRLLLDQYS
jgi:hypothetical protein